MRSLVRSSLALLLIALFAAVAFSQGKTPKKVDLSKPYQHKTHLKELRKQGDRLLSCPDCHTLSSTASGARPEICERVRMPFPTHDKCTGCHPTAFFTKPLVICTNCHVSAAFDKKPEMREQSGDEPPLRADFSHKLHLDPKERVKGKFKFNKHCTFCHAFSSADAVMPSLPSHPQCCECHTKSEVTPNINDCATCHMRPDEEKNPVSLVRKFSHADHRQDPTTGESVDCLRCHFQVPKATKVSAIHLPAMATCVECHQGEVAFDYVECLRCHGPEIQKLPIPENHKKKKKEP
jgi:hypothetical protein